MRNDEFREEIRNRFQRRGERSRVWTGLFLVVIGALFIAREAGVMLPAWLFTWPMLVFALGAFIFIKRRFRSFGGLILMIVGGVFLYDNIDPDISLRPFLWPAFFVVAGLMIMLRPRRHRKKKWLESTSSTTTGSVNDTADNLCWEETIDHNDVIDITTVFGGVKKKILSKHFRGGDITSIMGGTELDLRQADFKDRIVIDNLTIFGGTKLIMPAEWDVQSDVVAMFGGVDDKRPLPSEGTQRKVIVLEGTCLFGGIEIKNF